MTVVVREEMFKSIGYPAASDIERSGEGRKPCIKRGLSDRMVVRGGSSLEIIGINRGCNVLMDG